MFEHRRQPVLRRAAFVRRQLVFLTIAAIAVVGSLGVGALGYHAIEGRSWLDSTYSAAMILTGMGPATEVKTDSGKVFVTVYALFSGLVFLSAGALVIAPMFHRVVHRLHFEDVAGK